MTYTKPRNNSHKYPVKCLRMIEVKKEENQIMQNLLSKNIAWINNHYKGISYIEVLIVIMI